VTAIICLLFCGIFGVFLKTEKSNFSTYGAFSLPPTATVLCILFGLAYLILRTAIKISVIL
jgi:hypothetical protein